MKKVLKKLTISTLALTGCLMIASCGEDKETNKITLYFGGSTSVEKIAKALTAEFELECPSFEAVHNHTGSSDAYKRTQGKDKDSENKLHMGFLSRELKSSEEVQTGTSGLVCKDGIVAVVNKENNAINDANAELLTEIYSSDSVRWETVMGNSELTGSINRYSRDSSSGTRDGFFTTIGFEEAKTDDTKIPGTVIASSNGDMITKIKNDKYGIGYISLASVESSGLKALTYNGVTATEEGVVDGSYALQRNFNYCTRTEADCTEEEWLILQAFIAYMNSQEGLIIIKSTDGILTNSIANAPSWDSILEANPKFKEICR